MKQVAMKYIIDQIIVGNDPKFLCVEPLDINVADGQSDLIRGGIYYATFHESGGQNLVSFYNLNDSKLTPFILNVTSIHDNTILEKRLDELIGRVFRHIENLDEMISTVIEDPFEAILNKAIRIENCVNECNDNDGFHFYAKNAKEIIMAVKVRYFPKIAKRFNDTYTEGGLRKFLIDWHIDADLAEFSFYQG
ncbi:hypothetical protein ACOMCU_01425 [Lysinibacillus sp. UGB7]|uniref:hypothetical protein n=1 Tax=Lysinibacillus sp. UGB7 TaxID=3411039 RepID=UPI003B7CBAD1